MKGRGRSFQAGEVLSTKAMRQEELYMAKKIREVSVAAISQDVQGGRRS